MYFSHMWYMSRGEKPICYFVMFHKETFREKSVTYNSLMFHIIGK